MTLCMHLICLIYFVVSDSNAQRATICLLWLHFSPACRIRALYAHILEKDAVIKVFHQRLHQDQVEKGGFCLRAAMSTSSISTAKCASISKGKDESR